MRIERCLGTTEEAVRNKEHNVWIGISLGNKYFTKERLAKYLEWSLEFTKEDVVVVIADRIHAINIEVLARRSKMAAFKKAYRMGDLKQLELEDVIRELPKKDREKVHIARWRHIANSKYHDYRLEILFEAFRDRTEFYQRIMSVVDRQVQNNPKRLSNTDKEKLAEYILHEIPLFLNGAKYPVSFSDTGKVYTLQPYPGLGAIDKLIEGLQEGTLFPEIGEKLKITNPTAMVEAYTD